MEAWVKDLERVVEREGQKRVADTLGVSPSTISQVRHGKYKASSENIRSLFEEVYGGQPVECPVLGEITGAACLDNRGREFAATNPLRVRLWQACRCCPRNPNRVEGR